jgi:hypothetical protein
VFFAWSRETRSDGGLGWLEVARRANFATLVSSHRDASATGSAAGSATGSAAGSAAAGAPPRRGPASGTENVDDDDEQLAAYNDFLARINKPRER